MSRRGIAMIMVLASCVVLLAAAAVVARVRTSSALTAGATDGLAVALEMAEGCEDATLAWLGRESRDVVIEPGPSPVGIPVLSDRLRISDREIVVTITAWDQCAMLPNADLAGLPALQRLAANDGPDWLGTAHPGADLAGAFPDEDSPHAAAARFATHNPSPHGQRHRGGTSAAISVNTAPEPLLRAACTDLGIDGVELMLAARRSREKAVVTTTGSAASSRLRLVAASSVWSTRTDIRVAGPGSVSVSVWSVYTLRGGTWVREQRFVIAD